MCGKKSKQYCAFSERSRSSRAGFFFSSNWARSLVLLVLLLALALSPLYSAGIEPVGEMTDQELIDELASELNKLKQDNENLTLSNQKQAAQIEILKMQAIISGASIDQMGILYNNQGALLTEAWTLSESYSAEAEKRIKRADSEVWFWRIVGFLGAAYGAYQAAIH